jgi:hypothetical protein
VIAGIDIFDVTGERGRANANHERREIHDILDAHEPAPGLRAWSSSKHSMPDAARILSGPGESAAKALPHRRNAMLFRSATPTVKPFLVLNAAFSPVHSRP